MKPLILLLLALTTMPGVTHGAERIPVHGRVVEDKSTRVNVKVFEGFPEEDNRVEKARIMVENIQDAESREKQSAPYKFDHSTCTPPTTPCPSIWVQYRNWTVMNGTETFTLTDFVSSGRFCAIYGHIVYHGGISASPRWIYKCKICGAFYEKP